MERNLYSRDLILIEAIRKYGVTKQLDQLTEEVGELMQAINKLKRKTQKGEIFHHAPTKDCSIERSLAYWNVCSEIADVQIMLDQIKTIFSEEAVNLSDERKVERLKQRLING